MKKLLLTGLLIFTFTYSALTVAQDSCSDTLMNIRHEGLFDRESRAHGVGNLLLMTSASVGLAFAFSAPVITLPVFVVTAAIAASPLVIDEKIKDLRNHRIDKMLELIEQAEKYESGEARRPGRLLRKLYRKTDKRYSIKKLAAYIVAGNIDGSLCKVRSYNKLVTEVKEGKVVIINI